MKKIKLLIFILLIIQVFVNASNYDTDCEAMYNGSMKIQSIKINGTSTSW